MTAVKRPADVKAPDPARDAKKLFESYYLVAKQRLGRDPSFEDVLEIQNEKPKEQSALPQAQAMPISVAGQDQVGAPGRPKILDYRAYYGMTESEDGQRSPDPKKILFYEDPVTNSVFDCSNSDWCPKRPDVIDHLPHRQLEFTDQDIVAAIAHGIMDDDDFDGLDKSGLISEIPKALWTKSKELQKNLDELDALEKSESEFDNESDGEEEEEADNISEINTQAGVNPEDKLTELAEVHGEDVVSEIMQISLQMALTGMDEQIRAIVRDELGRGSSGSQSESFDDDEEETVDSEPELD